MSHPCSIISMDIIVGFLTDGQVFQPMNGTCECNRPLYVPSWTPTSNSMKQPLVRCGAYESHILTSALVPGRTGHTHTMLPKLSTATVTFHTQPAYLGLNNISERAPPIDWHGIGEVGNKIRKMRVMVELIQTFQPTHLINRQIQVPPNLPYNAINCLGACLGLTHHSRGCIIHGTIVQLFQKNEHLFTSQVRVMPIFLAPLFCRNGITPHECNLPSQNWTST